MPCCSASKFQGICGIYGAPSTPTVTIECLNVCYEITHHHSISVYRCTCFWGKNDHQSSSALNFLFYHELPNTRVLFRSYNQSHHQRHGAIVTASRLVPPSQFFRIFATAQLHCPHRAMTQTRCNSITRSCCWCRCTRTRLSM